MFSELIDRVIKITGRPDSLSDLVTAANGVMREISKRGDWADDTVEETVSFASNVNHAIWTPAVGRTRFRREHYISDVAHTSPTAVRPGRRMEKLSASYYRSGESFVIRGCVSPILIYYYAYPPWLKYYALNDRPAVFNTETGDFGDATAEQINLVSNWQLERHTKTVQEGTLASFFAAKNDPRQQVHYSAFEQGIRHIQRAEGIEELLNDV